MTKGDRLTMDRHLQEDFDDIRARLWAISWVSESDKPETIFSVGVDMDIETAEYLVKLEHTAGERGDNLDDVELEGWGVGVVTFQAVDNVVDGFNIDVTECECEGYVR
jgi:hypothetical protein